MFFVFIDIWYIVHRNSAMISSETYDKHKDKVRLSILYIYFYGKYFFKDTQLESLMA